MSGKSRIFVFSTQLLILVVIVNILYVFLLVIPNLDIHLYFLLNKRSRNIANNSFNFSSPNL